MGLYFIKEKPVIFTPAAKRFIFENKWEMMRIQALPRNDYFMILLYTRNGKVKIGDVEKKQVYRRFSFAGEYRNDSFRSTECTECKTVSELLIDFNRKYRDVLAFADLTTIITKFGETLILQVRGTQQYRLINFPIERIPPVTQALISYIRKNKFCDIIDAIVIYNVFNNNIADAYASSYMGDLSLFTYAYIGDVILFPPITEKTLKMVEQLIRIESR